MRSRPARWSSFALFFFPALTFFPLALNAEQGPSLDRRAVAKTKIAHASFGKVAGSAASLRGGQPSASVPFRGSPYSGGPIVTPTTTVPEADEHVAVDPEDFQNLVAVTSDFALRGAFNTTKFATSTDNGATWTEGYIPLDATQFPMTSDGVSWQANSDPVVAIGRDGQVYVMSLYLNTSDAANGIYISAGSLAQAGLGLSAANTLPVVTNPDPVTVVEEDKPWLAVDNTDSPYSGTLYVCWTRFIGGLANTNMILLARSFDGGQTWSDPTQINPPGHNGAVQGSQVAIGPNGEVYVVYEVSYIKNLRQHFLAKSTDGGASFSEPSSITPVFNELTFNSTYRKFSFASLAVDPNGFIYAVYPDQPNDAVGAEIEFVRSTEAGGATFTSPLVINDKSTGQQFMPALTVDSSGTIHAMWFDTRRSIRRTSEYDIFATRSSDGGATFTHNFRVTDQSQDAGTATFIGDYAGIAAGGGFAHPVWTSGGFNNGSLETSTLR